MRDKVSMIISEEEHIVSNEDIVDIGNKIGARIYKAGTSHYVCSSEEGENILKSVLRGLSGNYD